ncbi:peptidoglycan-binding domain-containing protein, partial [Okeania sp. SIO2B9]
EFAVRRFQQDAGTNASGVATRNTLQALRHPMIVNPSASKGGATYIGSQANVLELQKRLRLQGFYFGPLNGVYNSETRVAVAKAHLHYGLSAKDIGN